MSRCLNCLQDYPEAEMHIYKTWMSMGKLESKNTDKKTISICYTCYNKLINDDRYPNEFIDEVLKNR